MSGKKPYKVLVIGLPKTGTSTVAVMLRMLGYTVTGPENHFQKGDTASLEDRFARCNAFQDYPWCFEWERFAGRPGVKFLILERDPESWWQSFWESYGKKDARYKSFPYIQILKQENHKTQFLTYFEAYYQKASTFAKAHPNRVLVRRIDTLDWETLCAFLEEKKPRGLLGTLPEKPHAKKHYAVTRKQKKHVFLSGIREAILPLVGSKNWNAFIVFLRKNGWYS